MAPGLLFELGLARHLTYMRRPLVDRLLRFVGWSLLLNALLLPITAYVVRNVPDEVDRWRGGDWVVSYAVGLLATVGPFVAGSLVARRSSRVRRWVLGVDPDPLSWHRLWSTMAGAQDAYVRVHLESRAWVAGRFDYSSDEPGDLLLKPRLVCDPGTGELLLDAAGLVRTVDWATLIKFDEVERLEAQAHRWDWG